MTEPVGYAAGDIYCEVLFELAEESAKKVDAIYEDLIAVTAVLSSEPQFAGLLSSSAITGQQKAETIRRVFDGRVNELTLDFLSVLARRNRMRLIGLITDKFEKLVDSYHNRRLIEVTLPAEPDDEQLASLKADLSNAINSQVKLRIDVAPEIIGGVIIKTDDRIIDNSVRSALCRAAEQITKIELKI